MKKQQLLMIAIGLAVSASAGDPVDDYAPGRSGEALKNTIRSQCRPLSTIGPDEVTEILYDLSDDTPCDVFTGLPLNIIERTALSWAIPPDWLATSPDYMQESKADMHNIFLTDRETAYLRGTLPLADPVEGYDCMTPAKNLKGDIARKIFYAASLYPCNIWSGWGRNIFENNDYPTLRPDWSTHYMRWHRDDPVDDAERQRDSAIAGLQGNNNPFVTHPDLAEYLWGDRVGDVYRPQPDTPGEDPAPGCQQKIPLQKCYSLDDDYIWLYSPYIPADASWTVDGRNATERIAIASLGPGLHEVRYRTASSSGKLLIEIVP